MKSSKVCNPQINTQSDYCSLFICYLNLTCEIYEITKEIIFDLSGWQAEVAKHVWAKQTEDPGRQEREERKVEQTDQKVDTKVYE